LSFYSLTWRLTESLSVWYECIAMHVLFWFTYAKIANVSIHTYLSKK